MPLLGAVPPASANTYYVDADSRGGSASDSNPGTIDHPFKTITKARDTIRALGTDGHTVYIRGGTYYFSQSLQFGSSDSGAAGAPNRYVAYAGETPVLKGSIRIPTSAFSAYSGSIQQANAGAYGITHAAQVFFNGARLLKARYPNYKTPNYSATDPYAGSFLYVASDTPSSATQFTYVSGGVDPSRWTNVSEIEVDMFPGSNYKNFTRKVSSINTSTRMVTLASALGDPAKPNNRYYFANVFEELNAPNEYYFKTATSTLYLYPPHTLVATDQITVPAVADLISCSGVSYLEFRGLTISECDGMGVYVAAGHHITLDGCTVTGTGTEAIRLHQTYNGTVTNCTVAQAGGAGLYIDGSGSALRALTSSNHLISHNTIHDIGAFTKGSSGIFLDVAVGVTVSWNYLYNLPRIAIRFNGNDNVIAYNRTENINQETEDTGVIYQFGRSWPSRGNNIHHNYLKGSGGYGYSGGAWRAGYNSFSIYLDDFSSGTHIYNNTIVGAVSSPCFIHSGRDNRADHNTIVEPAGGPLALFNAWSYTNTMLDGMWTELQDCKSSLNGWNGAEYYRRYPQLSTITQAHPAQQDLMAYNSFTDNIVIYPRSARPLYYLGYLSRATSTFDRNAIWPGTNPITLTGHDGYTWSSWLAAGFDTNSRNLATVFGTAPQDYLLLVNTDAAAKTYSLGSQVYRDVNGTSVSGSVTLQPFESKVLLIQSGYSLIVTATNGSVTRTPDKTSYASGDVVTLQAVPNSGYAFANWSGDLTGTANPTTITMNGNKTVTANFTASTATYTLTINAVNGSVTKTPNQTSYASGAVVTLQAVPNTGYTFSGWSGDLSGTTNPTTITMNGNKTVTASFTAVAGTTTYSLTVNAVNGSVTKTPNQTSYSPGTVVTLQAVPSAGYSFSSWSGDVTGTANPTTITMNGNKSVTASFTANTYTLTVSAVNGSVTKTPNQTSYAYGTTVTLQAVPNAGYTFSGWSGDASGTANPTTITMTANKSVTANFTASTYTLTVSAVNGSVTKTPNQTSYASGAVVTLQAVPNAGYSFSSWSGDVTGTANPTTLTMNANKSVTAGFTANTYTLAVSAVNGSVTKTPNQTSYASGAVVTLQAVPNAGYSFSSWSGDVTGTANPTTLTMNGNKSVTAGFTANTYTLTVSAVNGSVTKTPNQTSYASGAVVTLQAVPNTGYTFSGWSGDVSGTANPTTVTMNANKSVTAGFKSAVDQVPPVVDNWSPAPDSIQAPPNTLVRLHVRDEGMGVDAASVSLHVNGQLVYAGDVNSYAGPLGVCSRSGTKADYTYTYEQKATYGYSREVSVTVAASDLAGNAMAEQTYSFATEMYVFGVNRSASADQTKLDQGKPALVGDGQGNLWIVWHAGNVGSRQIYAARYVPDTDHYNSSVQISQSTGDHCNPAVAIDGAGTLYVVWQENAGGVWDIYGSTSVDGRTWSAPKRVTDAPTNPLKNRINPALAASRQSPGLVAVAWQDDRAGNQEIHVSRSTNQFQTITSSRVTSQTAAQTNPALAIDNQDVIVVLWTDARNGATDIYGAASDNGPWTNVPVVNAAGNQSWPRVAAGSTGRVLHLTWVDEAAGKPDIFYAKADGLSAGPFPGVSVVDDTSGAAQRAPALTAAAGADGNDRVFICWEDERNLAYGGTTDLYFAEVSPGALRTNVLVDNDGTSGHQREVALGVDRSGYPGVVWVDDKGRTLQLYYSGATYADPVPLAEAALSAAAGGTVGTARTQIKTLDDVSVVIPAQACPFDATVRIARIHNPQGYATESLRQYDFGSSGLVFAQPVTITIPYSGSVNKKVKALWFDSVTGAFSSAGVTDVQDFAVAPGLRALQFKTTHFTPFYLVPADAAVDATGGGGCSLARSEETNPAGYCVPFLGLAATMLTLRRRDRRRASASLANHPESAK